MVSPFLNSFKFILKMKIKQNTQFLNFAVSSEKMLLQNRKKYIILLNKNEGS